MDRPRIQSRARTAQPNKKLEKVGDAGSSIVVLFTMPPQNRSNLVSTEAVFKNHHFEAILEIRAGIYVVPPEFS